MQPKTLNLAAFLALAQHEVQQAIEYLAQPEVRVQTPDAPAQIFAQIGTIKMSVPVRMAVWPEPVQHQPAPVCPTCGCRPAQPNTCPSCGGAVALAPTEAERDPRDVLCQGMLWCNPPGGKQPETRYFLNVNTVAGCAEEGGSGPVGRIEIEFITCLKQ